MAHLRKTEVGWVRITQHYVMLCEQNALPHGPSPARISSCSVAKNSHMNLQELFMAAKQPCGLGTHGAYVCTYICTCMCSQGPFLSFAVFFQCKCQCLKSSD